MSRAPRICGRAGCPNVVPCAEHTVARNDRQAKDPEQARFYRSSRWKQLSLQVRAQEPTCRICSDRPSTSVDHIDGDWRNNDRANLRGLCTTCERSRTARQHRARATRGGI